jgi:hypothetical protein
MATGNIADLKKVRTFTEKMPLNSSVVDGGDTSHQDRRCSVGKVS